MAMTGDERTARMNLKKTVAAAALLLGGTVLDVAGVIRMESGEIVILTHDGKRISAQEVAK